MIEFFNRIPDEILLEIIKKMEAASFGRLFCSSRRISLLLQNRKNIRIKSFGSLSLKSSTASLNGQIADERTLSTLSFFSLSLFKIEGEFDEENILTLCDLLARFSIRCRCLHTVALLPSQVSSIASILSPTSAVINLWHIDSQEEFHLLNILSCSKVFYLACESLRWISDPLMYLLEGHSSVILQAREKDDFEQKLNTLLMDWQKSPFLLKGRCLRASVELFFPSERPNKQDLFRNLSFRQIRIDRPCRLDLIPGEARLLLPKSEEFSHFALLERESDEAKVVVFERFDDATRFHGRRWMFIFCFSANRNELLEDMSQFCFGFKPVDFSEVELISQETDSSMTMAEL